MKWIGQQIYDFVSRFRNDVYLEDVSTGTIASGGNLGLDSNNKIVKAAEVGSSVDLTSEVTGILPVANGGSGASSLTDNAILSGTGTSAITAEDTSITSGVISRSGTIELAGTTVTLDSAANIELEVGGAGNYINTEGVFRGSNIGSILDNKIPVSPKDFISTNNRYPVFYILLDNGIKSSNTGTDACAEIVVPKGYTATSCVMKATDSDNDGTIRCYEGSTAGGAVAQLAASASTFSSGTVTDDFGSNTVVGDGTKTVIIVWNPGDLTDILHGGYITIAKTT